MRPHEISHGFFRSPYLLELDGITDRFESCHPEGGKRVVFIAAMRLNGSFLLPFSDSNYQRFNNVYQPFNKKVSHEISHEIGKKKLLSDDSVEMIRQLPGVLIRYGNDFVLVDFLQNWGILPPAAKIGNIGLGYIQSCRNRGEVVP